MTGLLKVAAVGDSASVAGFRILGFEGIEVGDPLEARDLWPRLAGGDYAVVFVTEPVYEAVADLAAAAVDKALPAVTVMPVAGRRGDVGRRKIDRAIERALGTSFPTQEEDG